MDAYEPLVSLAGGAGALHAKVFTISQQRKCVMTNFNATIPQPPRLRPTWTTWMWIGFMVAVVVLTTIGLWPNGVY
jgi:hypothetical protein